MRTATGSLRLGIVLLLAAISLMLTSCGGFGEVTHADYGDCARSGRHVHNDHVFLGDYHDHALCEWLKYE